MNLNWDEELSEYFQPRYLKDYRKIQQGRYVITTLQGSIVQFECTIEGYTCRCHGTKYQLPIGMLKEHSKQYAKAFNEELIAKLKQLAENEEDN